MLKHTIKKLGKKDNLIEKIIKNERLLVANLQTIKYCHLLSSIINI